MASQPTLAARTRLLREIAAKQREAARLQRALSDATRDIARLERTLRGLEREDVASQPTTRVTSARRLLVEAIILRRLQRNTPLETSTDELWPLAQAAGVLSRSTFRSQLHRLAAKGAITSAKPGHWRLAPGTVIHRIVDPKVEAALKGLQ